MDKNLSQEEIVSLYASGMLVKDIVEKSQYKCRSTIYRILKRTGINADRNPLIKLSNKEIKEIVRLYNSGSKVSALQLGEQFGISADSVLGILRDHGVAIRQQPRKHTINEDFFEVLTPDVMYVVGLIQADGHIHHDFLGFSIVQKDNELLEKIAIQMGANEDIIYEYKSGVPMLIVRSQKIVRSLMKRFKLHPSKSKTLEFPQVPDELIPSMLRGLYDGDGHFSKREAGFVTASESFALSFYEILQDYQLNPKLHLEKPNKIWHFRVYVRGKNNLNELNRILYSDDSILYREDKKIKLANAYKKDDLND